MLILYIMLKIFWKLETSLLHATLRIVRGAVGFGYGTDKTLDDIQILYDSPHFLVVNKSCDVIINHRDQERAVTVQKQLERLYPDLVNPTLKLSFYFPHRLDYATSGVLCIAKHKKACAAATKAFEQRQTKKFYLAIVRGLISQEVLAINEPIGEDTREKFRDVRMAAQSSPFCTKYTREATTNVVVLERGICYGYPATKILMRPVSGRRHQLRVHLSHVGHTIVGDFTYSNRRDLNPYRMFLHAYKLVLPNQLEHIDITTSDPFTSDDFRNRWTPKEIVVSIANALRYLEDIN